MSANLLVDDQAAAQASHDGSPGHAEDYNAATEKKATDADVRTASHSAAALPETSNDDDGADNGEDDDDDSEDDDDENDSEDDDSEDDDTSGVAAAPIKQSHSGKWFGKDAPSKKYGKDAPSKAQKAEAKAKGYILDKTGCKHKIPKSRRPRRATITIQFAI